MIGFLPTDEAFGVISLAMSIPRKCNREVCILPSLTLVPYLPCHVPRYNDWMKSPELLELTGSEPLTFEKEEKMCEEWRRDDKKRTFIILDGGASRTNADTDTQSDLPAGDGAVCNTDWVLKRLDRMVGDVNLFLSVEEELDETGSVCSSVFQAELEVMIAEPSGRRQGLATQACQFMIGEAFRAGVERVFVKVKDDNSPSLRMFEKMGFDFVKHVECFGETEMEIRKNSRSDFDVFRYKFIEAEP